jgi:BolA family transcriptional regulator, general stress-responsive regulator
MLVEKMAWIKLLSIKFGRSPMIEQNISEKLHTAFLPLLLSVENESHNHSSRQGSETHFKVTLVSTAFVGLSAVARHRAVYAILQNELQNGVHALALHTYAPEEWLGQSPVSPLCKGGEKAS